MINLGSLKIASGATSDGVSLMEEASFAAVNGELSPFTTGVTACRMISACRDLTDYRRASEWIEATERYCDRQSLAGFPGVCRVHRAEVAAVTGAWDSAEQELERATVELGRFKATPPQADGFYAIGDIRRLKGDFEGAEAALREAHERGRSPQPALALIRLAEGKVKAAGDRHRRRRRRRRPGIAGPGRACCRPRSRSRSRPATWRVARTAVDELGRDRRRVPVAGDGGRPPGRARPRASRRGRPAGAAHELRERRSRAGATWARRTRSPARGPCCRTRAASDRQRRRRRPRAAAGDSRRSSGSAPGWTSRRPNASRATSEDRRSRARRPRARRSCSPTSSDRRTWPRRSATRPGNDSCAGTTTCFARSWSRRGRGDRQLDRRRVLRRLRVGASRGIDAAIAIQRALVEHRDATGFALVGADRAAHGRGEPTRRGLQRQGRPRRRPGGRAGERRRDPRHHRDPGRGGRPTDGGCPFGAQIRGVTEPVDLAAVVWS